LGALIPGDALRMIEEVSIGDPVLLDDECDTAAEIYSCGRQKEPLIVDAIISTNKGNGSVVRIKYFEFRTAYVYNINSMVHLYLA
jgi:hypothetical protein